MPVLTVLALLKDYATRTRTAITNHFTGADSDVDAEAGFSTLEAAILALGMLLLAGLLVAAITAAVNTRIAQIN